jgi:hypothetical protein
MLAARAFGTLRVVVVKDFRQSQGQMHLDTYFNLLGPGLPPWRRIEFGHPGAPAIETA